MTTEMHQRLVGQERQRSMSDASIARVVCNHPVVDQSTTRIAVQIQCGNRVLLLSFTAPRSLAMGRNQELTGVLALFRIRNIPLTPPSFIDSINNRTLVCCRYIEQHRLLKDATNIIICGSFSASLA
jgi:hypothetical protein